MHIIIMNVSSLTQIPGSKIEKTRRRLVGAVRAEVLETGGFAADQVARRAGTSTPTFYNHFKSKDDALIASFQELMGDVLRLTEQKCQIERLLEEGLEALVADWWLKSAAFFKENGPLVRLVQSSLPRQQAMWTLFIEHEVEVIGIYQRFIELGQAAQCIRTGDSQAMAQMLNVIAQSSNHHLIQGLEPGGALHQEITQAMVRVLQPDPSNDAF